ncbi:MAG: hypothetical protein K1X79_12670 [Oligoflexia bacterium]|nr:hypothetical protein [Oligoflexia bacterium]
MVCKNVLIACCLLMSAQIAFADEQTSSNSGESLDSLALLDPALADSCKTNNGCGANDDPKRKLISCVKSADGSEVKFTIESSSGIRRTMECFDFPKGGCSCL